MSRSTRLLSHVALAVAWVLVAPPAPAQTLRYVSTQGVDAGDCTDPQSPCATLQYAVDGATAGDTVRMACGRYVGQLSLDQPNGLSPLTVEGGWSADFASRSDNPRATVLDGDGSLSTVGLVIWYSFDLTLRGLTVTNAEDCILAFNAPMSLTLEETIVTGCAYGLYLDTYNRHEQVVTLINTVVVGNRPGGGVRARAEGDDYTPATISLDILSSTITDNHLGLELGAIAYPPHSAWVSALVKDTVVWGNDTSDADLDGWTEDAVVLEVSYSDIGVVTSNYGGTYLPGAGLINADPGFTGPGPGIRLAPGSPCVDAGTDDGAPSVDFEGDPRPLDGDGDLEAVTDIGADELEPSRVFVDDFELGNTLDWSLTVP